MVSVIGPVNIGPAIIKLSRKWMANLLIFRGHTSHVLKLVDDSIFVLLIFISDYFTDNDHCNVHIIILFV